MKNTKVSQIVTAIIIIALGVLIAIFGAAAVLNLYFGILFIVAGALLLTLGIVKFVMNKELDFGLTFLSSALLAVGISLLTPWLSFEVFINLFVVILIAFGAALILFGIYTAIKHELFFGIGQVVVGIALVVVGVLYMTVPEFATAFWIIVGVFVAIYGAILLIRTFVKKAK